MKQLDQRERSRQFPVRAAAVDCCSGIIVDVLNDIVLSTEQGRRGNRRMELVFCLCTVFALLPLRERRCHRFRRHHASSSVPSRLGSFQLLAGRST